MIEDVVRHVQELGAPICRGYPHTGVRSPYIVVRPLSSTAEAQSLESTMVWSGEYAVYCVADTVWGSANLAMDVKKLLDGVYIDGTTLTASTSYTGSPVQGLYESLVTIQKMEV